jgi:hypothetical protein
MTNKEILDIYISKNYDELLKSASGILKRVNKQDLASLLVSEAYTFVFESKDSLGELTDNRLKSVFLNYMHKQIVWNGTDFKKNYISNLLLPTSKVEEFCEIHNDVDYEENIYIKNENNLEEEKYKQDLTNQLNQNYFKLSAPDKILFNLYYKSEYNSAEKIAKYINTSKSSVVGMLKKMKLQILEKNDTN